MRIFFYIVEFFNNSNFCRNGRGFSSCAFFLVLYFSSKVHIYQISFLYIFVIYLLFCFYILYTITISEGSKRGGFSLFQAGKMGNAIFNCNQDWIWLNTIWNIWINIFVIQKNRNLFIFHPFREKFNNLRSKWTRNSIIKCYLNIYELRNSPK